LAKRRRHGRDISGILVLNKPKGISSNGALQTTKRLFFAAKAGHTGSLDPLATGVLPICFGEATKFSQFLLDSDKRYVATIRLGVRTTTGDAEGEIIERKTAAYVDKQSLLSTLDLFVGEISQIPSMYSALKYQGKPLYKLAREGKEVERKVRQIKIYNLELLDFRAGEYAEFDIDIRCSKGTYVRSLAEDIGEQLGCGAHVTALHRSASGPFLDEDAISIEALEQMRGNATNALDRYW
jgi:tRNA pseudouridine55 synthase